MNAAGARGRDWGESAALLVGLVLFFALPNRYTIAGSTLTLALAVIYAITCALSVFWTLTGARASTARVMTAAAAALTLVVATDLAKVVYLVVYQPGSISGTRLLETALAIWIGTVIVFAVAYHGLGETDFLFPRPRDSTEPVVFLDYVFLAFTTATAFSPTDTPPLTTRARMYMMLEAGISLTTIAIAAARAINILS
jgi:hypothetical protein